MKRFVLTPRAQHDVNEIWDYVADDNIEAADRVLNALETTMAKLAKNPGIGHFREELTEGNIDDLEDRYIAEARLERRSPSLTGKQVLGLEH